MNNINNPSSRINRHAANEASADGGSLMLQKQTFNSAEEKKKKKLGAEHERSDKSLPPDESLPW